MMDKSFGSACIPEVFEVKNNEWFNVENVQSIDRIFEDANVQCNSQISSVKKITFGKNMNFKKLLSARSLFFVVNGIEEIDFSFFDTDNVQNFFINV